METYDLKRTSKIIYTDIIADRDREANIIKYQQIMASAFYNYAAIKLSLNFFTGLEMSDEYENSDIDTVGCILKESVLAGKKPTEDVLDSLTALREKITAKMKILTCYTDALEIYEYVLNRREAEVKNAVPEKVDIDSLADAMFRFVFSDNDKVIVNTRIQDFIAQLPVRITKQRFLDIVSNSLYIYKGGEQDSLKDFADTIKDAAIVKTPEGFETEYPELYEIYKKLAEADYSELTSEAYDELSLALSKATEKIESEVTTHLMIMEIINDALIMLYTGDMRDASYMSIPCAAAEKIIKTLAGAEDIYKAAEEVDELLPELEGQQEEAYEILASIESNLDELYNSYADEFPENSEMQENFKNLRRSDMLTSSSLFMDIDKDFSIINSAADEEFIETVKQDVTEALSEALKGKNKYVRRSMMAKVLATMPVFFNTQDEIKEYFVSALTGCGDNSELKACENIVNDIMLQI
jgi:hypothetical protein